MFVLRVVSCLFRCFFARHPRDLGFLCPLVAEVESPWPFSESLPLFLSGDLLFGLPRMLFGACGLRKCEKMSVVSCASGETDLGWPIMLFGVCGLRKCEKTSVFSCVLGVTLFSWWGTLDCLARSCLKWNKLNLYTMYHLTHWRRFDFAITHISHRLQPNYTWDFKGLIQYNDI